MPAYFTLVVAIVLLLVGLLFLVGRARRYAYYLNAQYESVPPLGSIVWTRSRAHCAPPGASPRQAAVPKQVATIGPRTPDVLDSDPVNAPYLPIIRSPKLPQKSVGPTMGQAHRVGLWIERSAALCDV